MRIVFDRTASCSFFTHSTCRSVWSHHESCRTDMINDQILWQSPLFTNYHLCTDFRRSGARQTRSSAHQDRGDLNFKGALSYLLGENNCAQTIYLGAIHQMAGIDCEPTKMRSDDGFIEPTSVGSLCDFLSPGVGSVCSVVLCQ